MTTLGDVFGKLSGVRLLSILKWYGRIVIWGFLVVGCAAVVTGFAILVGMLVTALPWWFTVGLLVLGSGWLALKIADPDALRSDFDRKMDKMNQDILMGNGMQKTVQRKSIDNWEEARATILEMDEEQGCNIFLDGKQYSFATRQIALDFLDGKKSL